MNRIIIKNNKLLLDNTDCIELNDNNIIIKKNTEVILNIEDNNVLMPIDITILDNVDSKLGIVSIGNNFNIKYNYTLGKNSNLKIEKFNKVKDINEDVVINLNDEKSNIEYIFKTVSNGMEKYNIDIYHNASNTICNLFNNGVNYSGFINYVVSSHINKGIKGCISNQSNRIINLCDNTCMIRPNLLIDEYDVIANHSAHIGTYPKDELFYLESRGITYDEAVILLTRGFLLSNINNTYISEKINETID